MAQKGVQMDGETFSCLICLDVPTNPVTIPCGHSYCMNCIKGYWDTKDDSMIRRWSQCPQCIQIFTPRPVLQKNTMLAAALEELKKTRLHADPADHCYAGAEDVSCDICPGSKVKAVKSCLRCLASYCEKHIQDHYEAAALKKHKLADPLKNLQEDICSRHDEVMKMFCKTDQQCICNICSVDEHKSHETVSTVTERGERQRELEVRRQTIQQKIQDREKDEKELQQEVDAFNGSADKAVQDGEKIFSKLICLIQKRSSDMKQQVSSQQEAEMSRVRELQEKLEQEIAELKREDAELKQISDIEVHTEFLRNYPSLSRFSQPTESPRVKILPLRRFEDVAAAVSELGDKLQDVLREKWISPTGMEVDVLPSPEPKTRAEFLEYSCEITLDPNTAHTNLLLSEGNRKAKAVLIKESDSSHPDRFTGCLQVLGRESLTGRCYWEVEWMGLGLYAAVAYKNISRAGGLNESAFGFNDKSWALNYSELNNTYMLLYNNVQTPVSGPRPSRIGVYLDHSAGILSFYSISETMTLLHRIQTTFSQPLYAGLRPLHFGASAVICTLK